MTETLMPNFGMTVGAPPTFPDGAAVDATFVANPTKYATDQAPTTVPANTTTGAEGTVQVPQVKAAPARRPVVPVAKA